MDDNTNTDQSAEDAGEILHLRFVENFASVLFGWCVALVVLTSSRIITNSILCYELSRFNLYLCLCSVLVLSSLLLAILVWAYLIGQLKPETAQFAAFLILWSVEAQMYFQIIISRIIVLNIRKPGPHALRITTAIIISSINLSMFFIWLPKELNQSEKSSHLSFWWPRLEKIFYLLIDLGLNSMFIYHVRKNLLSIGLFKYRRVIQYNLVIISLSVSCDFLLLGMQWYPYNDSLFIIIHPVAFLNKLILEMSICDKMVQVSKSIVETEMPMKRSASVQSSSLHKYNSVELMAGRAKEDTEHFKKGIDESSLIEYTPIPEEKALPKLPSMILRPKC